MIRGIVNATLEAVIRLRFRGPSGTESSINMIIDSGFSGSLILPENTVTALGLTRQTGSGAKLADGSVCQFDICVVEVEEIVETGAMVPDQVHLPGIYIHRIVLNAHPEKRIEKRTVRAAMAA